MPVAFEAQTHPSLSCTGLRIAGGTCGWAGASSMPKPFNWTYWAPPALPPKTSLNFEVLSQHARLLAALAMAIGRMVGLVFD